MNMLSILIYFADVAGNLKNFSMFLACASAFGLILYTIFYFAEELYERFESARSPFRYIWIPIALAVFSITLPSSETVKIIAASEIGEKILTSEKAGAIIDPSINILKNKLQIINKELEKELSTSK